MSEHKYISEHLERRTYIKGRFKGKFVGQLDKNKSDEKHERFFDLEILEGDIYTTQDNLSKWPEKVELSEFTMASSFPTQLPGEIRVTLQYLDGTEKYFKVKLRELKLINCRLTNQLHKDNELYGTLEGSVVGYLLHYDTIINEISGDTELKPPFRKLDDTIQIEPAFHTEEKIKPKLVPPIEPEIYNPHKKSSWLVLLGLLFAALFLIGFPLMIKHWLLFPLFLLLAILTFPRSCNWLITKLNLRLTRGFYTGLYTILFALTAYYLITCYQADKKMESTSKIVAEKTHRLATEKQRIKKQQKDSFNRYFNSAKTLQQNNKKDDALRELEKAALFAAPDERNSVNTETTRLYVSLADELVKENKFKEAIKVYSTLLLNDRSNSGYLYRRGWCYSQIDKIPEAVHDLKLAIDQGDKPAQLLHEKINPLKKRVAYYVTRCCDGTTSEAKGRGACSHHGGVCDWNDPVYEEYREYN